MHSDCKCREFGELARSLDDLMRRCAAASEIAATLRQIASNTTTWMSVLECEVCNQSWAEERPFSELLGGGPPCLYKIDSADPIAWLATAVPRFDSVRRRSEDREFLNTLGAEIGPEMCKRAGCGRKRIALSVLCRTHHFESVRGRSPALEAD
jgi:hypothetical protein